MSDLKNYILNIETATKNCSVSLSINGDVFVCEEFADEDSFSHAEKLHVFLEKMLVETKINYSDIACVAVSQGPGSYTGLRIGVSAAKGICYALNIPMIAIDTLEILAYQAVVSDGLILPMIDARRMEVYCAIFTSNYQKIRETKAEIITENSFEEIEKTIYIVGDCTEKCKPVLKNKNIIFLEKIKYPSSKEMGLIGFKKFRQKDFVNISSFEPFYLKEFASNISKK